MRNGMYSLSFMGSGSSVGTGTGAARDGQLHGGDASFGYVGTYTVNGKHLSAFIRVVQHREPAVSVFGPLRDFRLELTGTFEGDRFNLTGSIPGSPDQQITIRGRRFEDL